MSVININVFNPKDNQRVIAVLDELKAENIIAYSEVDDIGLPGKPLTEAELNKEIDEAEQSIKYSFEDARKIAEQW